MGGPTDRAARILDRAHRQTFHAHPDGTFTINTYQDVEPHLEHAARMRRADAESRGRFGKRRFMSPRMCAPFNVIMGIAQRLGIEPKDVFKPEQNKRIWKELESSDYKKLRMTNAKRL